MRQRTVSAGPGTGRASSGTCFPATIPNRRNFVPPPSRRVARVEKKVERASKEELVTQYNGIFKDAGVVVVTHYSGLSVPKSMICGTRWRKSAARSK